MTVGFDLDMTLIDPRPGVVAVIDALGEESGIPLDGEYFANTLGPPLDLTLRDVGAPEARIPSWSAGSASCTRTSSSRRPSPCPVRTRHSTPCAARVAEPLW